MAEHYTIFFITLFYNTNFLVVGFFYDPSLFVFPVASWFLSPLLSGLMSAIVFWFVRKFILHKVSLPLLNFQITQET